MGAEGAGLVANDIAIVGCGPVGVALLFALLDPGSGPRLPPGRLVVFEPAARPGPGAPYDDDLPTNRLNRTATRMSIHLEDPLDFYGWARSRRGAEAIGPHDFLPRSLFGLYLTERYGEAVEGLSRQGWTVTLVQDRVRSIEPAGDGYRLGCANGAIWRANVVVLCTGSGLSRAFAHLEGAPGFVASPYPTRQLADLRTDAAVAIVGSRLRAMDAVLALDAFKHSGPIWLASRSGLMPIVGAGEGRYELSASARGAIDRAEREGLSLRRLLRLVLGEMRRAEQGPVRSRALHGARTRQDPLADLTTSIDEARRGPRGWQDAFGALLPEIGVLWRALPDDAKQRVRAAFSRIEATRVPMPLVTAERLATLLAQERVRLAWPLEAIRWSGRGFDLTLGADHTRRTLAVDVVINCTAASDRVAGQGDAPYPVLLALGLARRDAWGGVEIDPATSRVIASPGVQSQGLFALGAMTSGAHLVTSSLAVNLHQLRRCAPHLLHAVRAARAHPARPGPSPILSRGELACR